MRAEAGPSPVISGVRLCHPAVPSEARAEAASSALLHTVRGAGIWVVNCCALTLWKRPVASSMARGRTRELLSCAGAGIVGPCPWAFRMPALPFACTD